MCSINEDVMLTDNHAKNKINLTSCKKCLSDKPSILLRKIDVYCKSCFLEASTHKFRGMLGKYRLIHPNDKVLVVYRTGHPSRSLLHLIYTGLNLPQHKKLKFQPIFLFITEDIDMEMNEHTELLRKVNEEVIKNGFPIFFTSLHEYIKNPDEPAVLEFKEYIMCYGKHENHLKHLKVSDSIDISEVYKKNLLISVAKKLDCKIVLLPDINKDITVGILSNISLGRGAHLAINMGVIDNRDPDIKIVTPLRLFEIKEIVFYNYFNNLDTINVSGTKNTSSVQSLLKKFVEDLQVNYQSTINTVASTGNKLSCPDSVNVCKLCKLPIETQSRLSSSEALRFSQWISTSCSDDITKFQNNQNGDKNYCFTCSKLKR